MTDSAPKGLAGELQNAILGLKVERNLGGVAARELLESDEVQLAMKWLVAHGYAVGRYAYPRFYTRRTTSAIR